MAQPEKRENSVLFSLRELRTIEESRVKEEEDAAKEAEQARVRARLDAERRVKDEEDAKVRAAEEAARHEREMTEMRLREEQMRIQEAEARARAEHQAKLEASRLQHEMEIRRVEAHKKRPTWLVVTVGVALAAGGGRCDTSALAVGFVDLHNHCLFGLDDGARDLPASRAMLSALTALGFTEVYATPHQKAGQFMPTRAITPARPPPARSRPARSRRDRRRGG